MQMWAWPAAEIYGSAAVLPVLHRPVALEAGQNVHHHLDDLHDHAHHHVDDQI